jgi:capsular exopolysaccharide synthesis family protein
MTMTIERPEELVTTVSDATDPESEFDASGAWLQARAAPGDLAARPEILDQWQVPETDELFRSIYTRAGTGFATEVVAICSALAGEGKTTVAIGLATTIAQDFPDRRVLLVEADVQHPVLADDFEVAPTPGLVDALIGAEPLQNAARPTYIPNLHIMPAGDPSSAPGRPLRSTAMAEVVDLMRQSYDIVLLDLPALLVNSDAVLLTDLCDGVICVVRQGVTPIATVNRAMEQIDESKIRGVVLNGVKTSLPGWVRSIAGA